MHDESWPLPDGLSSNLILEGVSTLFEALGRAMICLDREFHIVHASSGLDTLVGEGVAKSIIGRPIEQVLGAEILGPGGTLRLALMAGHRREGWGAVLQIDDAKPRLMSITAAPIIHKPGSICDPRVNFIIVLRPAEDDQQKGSAAPTIFSGLVARSAAMQKIFQLIEHLADSDATVLITGESGTGKELVARAIHNHSERARKPFIPVNCGALPEDLLESELFGHVKGAFTGAVRDREGRFEVARGGTILLDEVAEMPLHLQVKLLRVLQEKTFERVGESTPHTTDARVLAATNRDLRRAVLDGDFRDDLYYRLRVVPIEVPPLRQRREDIEPLAYHLLNRVGRRHDRAVRLGQEAMRAILRYDWPGNVRELENALEYAVAVSKGQTLHVRDLPVEVGDPGAPDRLAPISAPPTEGATPDAPEAAPLAPAAAEAVSTPEHGSEPERIRAALDANQWRRSAAAAELGMSRTTLWRKMREHGLLQ